MWSYSQHDQTPVHRVCRSSGSGSNFSKSAYSPWQRGINTDREPARLFIQSWGMGCTSNQTCGIRYHTASIQLCSLSVWTKAPLDIFFKNSTRHSPFSWTARACHSGFACAGYHGTCYHTGRMESFRTSSLLRWSIQPEPHHKSMRHLLRSQALLCAKLSSKPTSHRMRRKLRPCKRVHKGKRWIIEDAVWASEGILA